MEAKSGPEEAGYRRTGERVAVVQVGYFLVKQIEAYLNKSEDVPLDSDSVDILHSLTAMFDFEENDLVQYEVDLRVINTLSGPYLDATLFRDGAEYMSLPARYTLLGDHRFVTHAGTFVVRVVTKTEASEEINKRFADTETSKVNPGTPSDFYKELRAFKKKYPGVYFETWTPDDFDLNWNDPDCAKVVDALVHSFNAERGTNWKMLGRAKVSVGIQEKVSSDDDQ